MRQLSDAEMLSLREILQMETNSLVQAKAIQAIVQDDELKSQVEAGILAQEGRIKGIQQFISENKIINPQEVN